KKYLGVHLIIEFWKGKIIEEPKKIKQLLISAAKKAGSTPLKFVVHKFTPQGVTGVLLLAESHIAFHFWPEFNYMAIDIFTCGDKTMPQRALEYLKEELQPKKNKIITIIRGKL
ncbi:adenosylmethionine decarboxylase, partial [Patescibacteria group bacterium]|nr:adenosylmethionine decarboxylase [Patescibacteria group bacterium]MBU1871067.1 adenosylmethionine decarboxylase [Patescibacteria group bacterium]